MKPRTSNHFTADDLDAFHTGALSAEVRLHLETCVECKLLVAADRQVLELLGSMTILAPSAGLVDRVISQVQIAEPVPVPVLSYPKFTRPRIAAAVALAAGMIASVGWSSVYGALLQQWLDGSTAALWNFGTSAWQTAAGILTSQPWFESARQFSDAPFRLALFAAVLVGCYGTGLLALRRLVTPAAGTVPNVGA